jgi:acetyl esterase/lipase
MAAISGFLASSDNNSPNIGIAYTSVVGTGGTSGNYELDIYHLNERSRGSRPVVIGIHGGGWCIGNKSLSAFVKYKADFFVRKNKCIFVSINYRLSPPGFLVGLGTALWSASRIKFPDHYNDMAIAIKWVRDNISSYGGDPDKLILMGHSAGAQSAILLATNHEFINAVGVPTSSIKAAISVDTEGFNILDTILNPTADTSITTNPSEQRETYENAFGIYPGIHTGFLYQTKDYVNVGIATTTYDRASPDQNLSTPNIPKLMILGRGDSARVSKQNDFYANMVSAGIAGTYISYPNDVDGVIKTYTHEEISDSIGFPIDPPQGRTLPVGIGNVSMEIINFISGLNL